SFVVTVSLKHSDTQVELFRIIGEAAHRHVTPQRYRTRTATVGPRWFAGILASNYAGEQKLASEFKLRDVELCNPVQHDQGSAGLFCVNVPHGWIRHEALTSESAQPLALVLPRNSKRPAIRRGRLEPCEDPGNCVTTILFL